MRFFNTIVKFVLIWSLIGFNNFAISENLVEKAANRANFEPGGEFHLFGARGGVTDRTGEIKLGLSVSENLGSIRIERQFAAGEIEYKTKFSGHGWEEHSPFANASSKHKETKKPQSDDLERIAFLDWTGVEIQSPAATGNPIFYHKDRNFSNPTGARDEYSYNVYAVRQKVSVITPDYRDHFNKFIDKKDRINQAYSDAVNNNFEDAYHRGINGKEGNLNALGDTAQRLKGLGKDVEAGLDYAWDTSGALLSSTAGLTSETLGASAASLAQPVFDRLSVETQFSTIDGLLEKQQQIKDFSDTSYDYYQQNVVPVIDKTLEPVRENVVKPVIQKYDELQTNYGEFATDHPNIAEAIAAGGAILDATPAGQGKKQALKQAKNLTEEIGKNSGRGTEKVADSSNSAKKTKGEIVQENNQKGKNYERVEYNKEVNNGNSFEQQVYVETDNGNRTILDMAGTDKDGHFVCIECKSSDTARLTKKQQPAFPEITESGATVKSKNKESLPYGTRIPPTDVEIRRPSGSTFIIPAKKNTGD